MSFVLLMLSGGAIAAAVAAAVGAPVLVQGGVFVVVSLFALWGVRPYAKRLRESPEGETDSLGLRSIEGSPAVVVQRVDNRGGLIKLDGVEWTARALEGDQVFEPGEDVNVIEIRGATAIVWRQ
ncbi:NfeD family protein [Stackebrandtia soli]|uniref:NfeD family protein n=1 Tax=Stackebrandtia soli TaxID=1892856 RepID=UPI0039EBA4E8